MKVKEALDKPDHRDHRDHRVLRDNLDNKDRSCLPIKDQVSTATSLNFRQFLSVEKIIDIRN